jgi:hypothetical protein
MQHLNFDATISGHMQHPAMMEAATANAIHHARVLSIEDMSTGL